MRNKQKNKHLNLYNIMNIYEYIEKQIHGGSIVKLFCKVCPDAFRTVCILSCGTQVHDFQCDHVFFHSHSLLLLYKLLLINYWLAFESDMIFVNGVWCSLSYVNYSTNHTYNVYIYIKHVIFLKLYVLNCLHTWPV